MLSLNRIVMALGWRKGSDRPAGLFWLLPAVVALLRALPYLAARFGSAAPGETLLRVGYIPPDLLSYLAFIRQASRSGTFLLHDPFTTTEQGGRFILLLHWLLGQVARVTGWEPDVVFELSRVPLTFLFFGTLWWFLRPLLPDRRERYAACLLVAFSGGIEGLLKPLAGWLPEFVRERFLGGVWHLYGWNTFEALYNPLWIAGLTLLMVVIRPALDPQGPRSWRQSLQLGLAFLLLYLVHPYSALAALAIVVAVPIGEAVFWRTAAPRRLVRLAAGLVPALLLAALISRWQTQDPVYRAASGNVLGTLELQVFWYPLTLGMLGLLAAWGAQDWLRQAHPYRVSLLSWVAAVVFLHTSPVFNGYHFVCYLHLPLCVLAAPVLLRFVDQLSSAESMRRLTAAALIFATFFSCLLVTAESIGDVRRRNGVPRAYFEIIRVLAEQPAGNVLAPPELGNVIPAHTDHRVWVGHWFLTPDYRAKSAAYGQFVGEPDRIPRLIEVVDSERIRYLIVPREAGRRVTEALRWRVIHRESHGELELLMLGDGA